MKRIKDFKSKLFFTGVFCVCLLLLWRLNYTCIFRMLFHIPCPGCGMTRAYISLLHLDFAAAFSYHPMFWSVPILYLYLLFDGNLFRRKILNRCVLLLIGAGFAVNWIMKFFV